MFIFTTSYCQNTHEIIFTITNPLVIKKQYPNATKVNVEIFVQDLQDSLFLYYFNQYVNPSYSISDWKREFYKEATIGLNCVIENKNNRIILPILTGTSFKNPKDEIKNAMSRTFASYEQKFYRKQLDEKEVFDYDLAKYEIKNEIQKLELFPLLNEYHQNFPKGKYYLYFVYSFYETIESKFYPSIFLDNNKPNDDKIFRGYFVSNKVKLIVE